jgi:hypothetical protein
MKSGGNLTSVCEFDYIYAISDLFFIISECFLCILIKIDLKLKLTVRRKIKTLLGLPTNVCAGDVVAQNKYAIVSDVCITDSM